MAATVWLACPPTITLPTFALEIHALLILAPLIFIQLMPAAKPSSSRSF
jgi:hypothetical protein